MTNQQYPIIPSPELVQQWRDSPEYTDGKRKLVMVTLSTGKLQDIAIKASQWGADQELEACCEWLQKGFADVGDFPAELRAARRPKPPSLKEQALEALDQEEEGLNESEWEQRFAIIRRALEQLND